MAVEFVDLGRRVVPESTKKKSTYFVAYEVVWLGEQSGSDAGSHTLEH